MERARDLLQGVAASTDDGLHTTKLLQRQQPEGAPSVRPATLKTGENE
jgi:hypothetical protein